MKSVPYDLNFVFIDLLETPHSNIKLRLVLEIKNVASFIKTRLFWKWDCIKTHK